MRMPNQPSENDQQEGWRRCKGRLWAHWLTQIGAYLAVLGLKVTTQTQL